MLYLFVYIDTYFVLTYFLYHVVKNVLDWFQVVFWFNKKTTQSACVRLEPLFGPHLALQAAATLPTPPLGEQEQDQHIPGLYLDVCLSYSAYWSFER